ncbi:MAG: CidA/LrgA family protein [Paraclostridium sp.]
MKILNQLALVLGIWVLGEYLSVFIQSIVVIPGSIIGMILLFIALQLNIIKLDSIDTVGNFFLDNMAIFFVPSGVSLIGSLDIISENLFVLLVSVIVTTVLVMYVTGIVVDKMIRNKPKEDNNV